MKIRLPYLVGSVLFAQMAGVIGSLVTFEAIPTWYAVLTKPWFSPPNWVFGPVWLTLYAMMGIAAYLVWERGGKVAGYALKVYVAQLAFNTSWSLVFFGMKDPLLAFGNIIALLALIVLNIIEFNKVDRRAALLLIPYLLWVSFATVLNFYIVLLNPLV